MKNKILSQNQFITDYNSAHREDFNRELFERSEDDIIAAIKDISLSFQRENANYKIYIRDFVTIKDYEQVQNEMYEYTEARVKDKKHVENSYAYINLKDSDCVMLKIIYDIYDFDSKIEEWVHESFEVLILVPKIVDKYYFKLNGNYYFAMYQIGENCTYNNNHSKNTKNSCVTFSPYASPIRILRNTVPLKTVTGEPKTLCQYTLGAFGKTCNVIKVFFATFGLYETIDFLGLDGIYLYSSLPTEDENIYVFNKGSIYVGVNKILFQNEIIQTVVACIIKSCTSHTKLGDIVTKLFWETNLGAEYSSNRNRGLMILKSLNDAYDILTKKAIRLPEEEKDTFLKVLRWMIREYNVLKQRDNLNLDSKRINFSEYIASLYAMEINLKLHRINESNHSLKRIKQHLVTQPDMLISSISKCNVVSYKNITNDLDSIMAIKYTYKPVTPDTVKGMKRRLPPNLRGLHPSYVGRIDMDTSPKSDPGHTGMLSPYCKLYDNCFSDEMEPNNWTESFDKMLTNYKESAGLKDVFVARNVLLGEDHTNSIDKVNQELNSIESILNVANDSYSGTMYPLEESGMINIEHY